MTPFIRDDPFIVYMTDEFINECFDLVHKLLNAFGAYCKTSDPISTIEIEITPTTT